MMTPKLTAKQMEEAIDALNIAELRDLGEAVGAAPELMNPHVNYSIEKVRAVVYQTISMETDRVFMARDWLMARQEKPGDEQT